MTLLCLPFFHALYTFPTEKPNTLILKYSRLGIGFHQCQKMFSFVFSDSFLSFDLSHGSACVPAMRNLLIIQIPRV